MNAAMPAQASVPSLAQWMRERLAHFEQAAAARLPSAADEPKRLHEAMRYAVLDGGKRVRPLLLYAAGELAGAAPAALDAAALAVEYVHVYSLIHDDLPCMDDDVLRRGKPTVHVAFDEATAMLAGDALQAEAFKVLADAPLAPEQATAVMRELAHAAATEGMCGGQAIDLAAVGRSLTVDELERMHRMKTGALLCASVRMGALAGRAVAVLLQAVDRYGRAIGLAFQIVDDVLDVEGASADLGKTSGKDAVAGKPTYPALFGLAQSKTLAADAVARADAALAGAGLAASHLPAIARWIVERRS
jgi:farnesyl diphosphate synthase